MKIHVLNNRTKTSQQVVQKLEELLIQENFELVENNPDIVISVGGDGTLLSAFHRYAYKLDKVRFIGVHTGHLGFYTDWREFNLDELIEGLKEDDGEYIDYPLLEVEVEYVNSKKMEHFLALNESTIKKVDGTMVCDVYIRDEFFERFRGDGICISTPTGSTAYNKSVGGAVLHPRLEALQLAEIASLNNRVFKTLGSPLVIAPDEWIKISVRQDDSFVIGIDQLVTNEIEVKEIRYRIAKERIRFARYQHTHFWDRVEDAFLGVKKSSGDHLDS